MCQLQLKTDVIRAPDVGWKSGRSWICLSTIDAHEDRCITDVWIDEPVVLC